RPAAGRQPNGAIVLLPGAPSARSRSAPASPRRPDRPEVVSAGPAAPRGRGRGHRLQPLLRVVPVGGLRAVLEDPLGTGRRVVARRGAPDPTAGVARGLLRRRAHPGRGAGRLAGWVVVVTGLTDWCGRPARRLLPMYPARLHHRAGR